MIGTEHIMTNLTLATMSLFGITGVATISDAMFPGWMQYGAFGLCCVLVVYLMYQVNKMGDIIGQKDKEYIELIKQDIKSRERLTEVLQDRPCIHNDQRVRQ